MHAAISRQEPTMTNFDHVRPDPELMQPRDGANPGPECPSCGTLSTRLPRGRWWCANIRCDAVFAAGGPAGIVVVGRVARSGVVPIAVLPAARSAGGARLDEGLGEEVPISTTDMTWYAVRVATGCEMAVRDDIGMMRLATYVPIRLTWRRTKRRYMSAKCEPVERPLISGYVMLGAWRGYAVDWIDVRSVDDVIGPVLSASGAPAVIAGEVIRSLIHREVAGEFRDPAPDAPKPPRRDRVVTVKVGDAVKLAGTDYTDTVMSIEGIYAALASSGVKVHLDSLKLAG